MTYDPFNSRHRRSLAVRLSTKLADCGFQRVERAGCDEAVYARDVDGTDGLIRVLVYTSIVTRATGPEVRGKDGDSIKVCAVYTSPRDGKERGLVKNRRVHRSGDILGKDGIIDRVYGRMREVYGLCLNPERCSCGSPKFTSKAGNLVCADLCFKTDEELARPYVPRRRTRRSYRRRA